MGCFSNSDFSSVGLTIIGGGPAGLAPLLAAHRHGLLTDVLGRGVVIVEQSDSLGGGDIGRYAINSDSTGRTFVDCLNSTDDTALTALRGHPLAMAVAAAGEGPVPLEIVGQFLSLVGEALAGMVANHPNCAILTGHRAIRVQQGAGSWRIFASDRLGRGIEISSEYVVSATGAEQPRARLAEEIVAGVRLAERCAGKLLQSGELFASGGFDDLAWRLKQVSDPRVAIVGGSTSAASAAHALLHRLPGVRFGDGAVTLLHRRCLRIYYPSAADALAEGYTEFGDDDICPISQRVFRFAGFRLESRELIMQARGIGGRPPEKRLTLHALREADPTAIEILDRADIVIAALGYRPRAVPVVDRTGEPIALLAQLGPQLPLVDGQCRIMDAQGVPIPGLFGIGLAAGFIPRGRLGGEPSFSGQANGLWLWQNDVGLLIVDAILGDRKIYNCGHTALQAHTDQLEVEFGKALQSVGPGKDCRAAALQ
jgi:hypothetical protein